MVFKNCTNINKSEEIWKEILTGKLHLLRNMYRKSCPFQVFYTPPWVFFTFFKLYKCYEIAQLITNAIWKARSWAEIADPSNLSWDCKNAFIDVQILEYCKFSIIIYAILQSACTFSICFSAKTRDTILKV